MKETRPPLGNRVLENASTVGHRFDGSKDTRSRDLGNATSTMRG